MAEVKPTLEAEEVTVEHKAVEAAAPPVSKCEAVPPGGKCANCGWDWSSPEPHPAYFGMARNEIIPVAPPPKREAPAPSPSACEAINLTATCPKCGWNAAEQSKKLAPEPHPVLAY